MVVAMHEPEWPDKVMAGALLVTIAGVLGLVYVMVRLSGATVGQEVPAILHGYPIPLTGASAMAATALGVLGYRYQSTLLVTLGALAAIVSVGMLGIASLLGIMAFWPLARAYIEGEETVLDHRTMSPRRWPDKAVMASVLLAAGAAASLAQGILLFADGLRAPLFEDTPWIWGVVSTLAAAIAFAGSRSAYRLRRPRVAWAGALLTVVATALYVVGPVLGLGAVVYLTLAGREDEFTTHGQTA